MKYVHIQYTNRLVQICGNNCLNYTIYIEYIIAIVKLLCIKSYKAKDYWKLIRLNGISVFLNLFKVQGTKPLEKSLHWNDVWRLKDYGSEDLERVMQFDFNRREDDNYYASVWLHAA